MSYQVISARGDDVYAFVNDEDEYEDENDWA